MAGQSDWEAPVPERRFPLFVKKSDLISSIALPDISYSVLASVINCLQRAL